MNDIHIHMEYVPCHSKQITLLTRVCFPYQLPIFEIRSRVSLLPLRSSSATSHPWPSLTTQPIRAARKVASLPAAVARTPKYCLADCQQSHWPSRNVLCKTFKDFQERPHSDMRHVIAFPPGELTPKLMWYHVERQIGYERVDCKELMGSAISHPGLVSHHAFTKKALKDPINISYDDHPFSKYPKPNKSIIKATGSRLALLWRNPIFAECGVKAVDSLDRVQIKEINTCTFGRHVSSDQVTR